MLKYQAKTMSDALYVARNALHQSRDDVAAGATLLGHRTVKRDIIRRLEGGAPAIDEDHADPLILRAIAGHFECPVADLSPRCARILREQGIPELHPEPSQNWKKMSPVHAHAA